MEKRYIWSLLLPFDIDSSLRALSDGLLLPLTMCDSLNEFDSPNKQIIINIDILVIRCAFSVGGSLLPLLAFSLLPFASQPLQMDHHPTHRSHWLTTSRLLSAHLSTTSLEVPIHQPDIESNTQDLYDYITASRECETPGYL